jgi:energy-converting hydrogenase B subunit D
MTEILQIALLVMVALGSIAVVTTREVVSQTIILSFYGLFLALLLFVFQAPDVALSEIVVGSVALPLMVLLAVAKSRGEE